MIDSYIISFRDDFRTIPVSFQNIYTESSNIRRRDFQNLCFLTKVAPKLLGISPNILPRVLFDGALLHTEKSRMVMILGSFLSISRIFRLILQIFVAEMRKQIFLKLVLFSLMWLKMSPSDQEFRPELSSVVLS